MKTALRLTLALLLCVSLCLCLAPGAWAEGESVTTFDAGDKVTIPADTSERTPYAVWKRTYSTIYFDGNGSPSDPDTMAPQTGPDGGSITLAWNAFEPPVVSGRTLIFAGWSMSPYGNIEYTDGQTIDVPAGDITLYAIWRDRITITFRPESASGTGEPSNTIYKQYVPSGVETVLRANTYTPPSSSRAFAGWSDRYDGAGSWYVDRDAAAWTGAVTLYAQWGPAVTITFDKNSSDAVGTMADQRVAAETAFKLNRLGFRSSVAAFLGWAVTPGGQPLYGDEDIVSGVYTDMTLYAQWKKHSISGSVTVHGSVSEDSALAYAGETLTANVTGETWFTDFSYQWKINGVALPYDPGDPHFDAINPNVFYVQPEDFGAAITCEVSAAGAQNKKISNTKYVGIEDSEKRIVNNGATEAAWLSGVLPGMYYSVNNGARSQVTSTPFEMTRQGVYRFYADAASSVALATVDVVNWYTVGYSVSTGSGSGAVTAKCGDRTLSASATITEDGVLLLQPYSAVGSYDHVWIIREGSGLGFSVTVKPASGSSRRVSLNGGGYDSGATEKTYTLSPVTGCAMYEIVFIKSSTGTLPLTDKTLTLPASLTAIGEEAFAGGAFDFVKLSENAASIGKNAFADCPNLTYVFIPGMNTQIDPEAFGNRTALIVYGYSGSTAQTFAQEHGFTFVIYSPRQSG